MKPIIFNKTQPSIPSYILVAGSGWISRIIIAGIQIASIPIIFQFLGLQDYATFSIITGLVVWFKLTDIGLGSSIQNHISKLRVQQDNVQAFIDSIALFIILLALIEISIFFIGAHFLQSLLLRKINPHPPYYLLALAGTFYIITGVFDISYRIFFAKHKGYLSYLYQTIGMLVAMVLVLVFYFTKTDHRLLWVISGWMLPQALCSTMGFLQVAPYQRWVRAANFKVFLKTLSNAWRFNLSTIGLACILGVDYIIMSQTLQANDIAAYNVFNKAFGFIFYNYTIMLAALWPTMAEKFVSQNQEKVRRANQLLLRNIAIATFFMLLLTIIIIATKTWIILFVSRSTLTISSWTVLLFGLYYSIRIWVDSYIMILQSYNKLKIFFFSIPPQAILEYCLMYYLGRTWGINGFLVGLILSFALTAGWILPLYYYHSTKLR
jgi:O-antigen/teichoic acid export membrane protein